MTTSHTAHGLASLGRHGDTMLVHMSPHEVAGLNYLAKKQGTSLTINPHTGLPEAFSLGGFFKGLLPMFAGAMTGGAGMPLWAGIAAGAATGAATNKDHLMGALTGGLGGYGGFNLGQGFAAAGTPTPPSVATSGYVDPMTAANATDVVKQGIANPLSGMNTGLQTQNLYPTNLLNQANASGFAGSAGTGATGVDKSFLGGLDKMGSGIKNIATGQEGAWDKFKNYYTPEGSKQISDLAGYSKIAMPIGGAVLSGIEPSDIYGEPIKPSTKDKYDPYSTLSLGNDTGLRLVAEGGYIDGYAVGGTVTTGGLRDLYSATDTQTNPALSRDGYGVGRLDSLAREQSLNQAQTMGYAMGGPVSFADGGDATKEDLPALDQNMGLGSIIPTSSPTASAQTVPSQAVQTAAATLGNAPSSDGSIVTQVVNNLKADPNYQPKNPIESAIVKQIKGTDQAQQGQGLGSLAPSQPMAPSYNPSVAMGPTYYAGMNAPRGYAHGGYLDGQGDGMSDSIPATIEGKQPARLADGEFVVPADVVSHIGNGSSKAGSKRLYSMLDRVRKARTGHTKQGKEIKPEKYMPA
jgi:hypothetical protein